MEETIQILILGCTRTKDCSRSILDYAIVDLKESQNRKGYNIMQAWFDNDNMFNQIKSSDVGQIFDADVYFEPTSNGQVRMKIKNVYN